MSNPTLCTKIHSSIYGTFYFAIINYMKSIQSLIGPFPDLTPVVPETVESVDCGPYIREKITYEVEPGDTVSAYVCVPKDLTSPAPAVFCHHQHHGEFDIGKSEVVGLMGDPDQAYASELAERGYITFAPDAIAFEERNWASPGSSEYHELATRLVRGQTLMAKVLYDAMQGINYLTSRSDVDNDRIGFIGHSYGGRMALWLPAFDARIKSSVSNCGCVSYEDSVGRDAGIQMEFCIPGFMQQHDVKDVVSLFKDCALLISATSDDKWSRGAESLYNAVRPVLGNTVELKTYSGKHMFTPEMRQRAYEFLDKTLI